MDKLIFWMLLAHFIADFPLQGDFLAQFKGKYDYILFVHCMIWTGCLGVILATVHGSFAYEVAAFLAVGHFFIDRWKARKEDKSLALTCDLWLDQSLHVLQIVLVAWWVTT